LSEPEWTGRLKLVSKGNDCTIKLEDKNSGELFAKCPIEQYPGIAIESVADSSRYFVLRLQDDNGVFSEIPIDETIAIFKFLFLGRSAFIGIGFTDRSDSFDLNVALQDHFKRLQTDQAIEKEKDEPKQQLDLSFKEGETIKINMKITVSNNANDVFLYINEKLIS
jgi:adaptin ear-binding coat-associated protein 1/2